MSAFILAVLVSDLGEEPRWIDEELAQGSARKLAAKVLSGPIPPHT